MTSPSQAREGAAFAICFQDFRTRGHLPRLFLAPQQHNTFPNHEYQVKSLQLLAGSAKLCISALLRQDLSCVCDVPPTSVVPILRSATVLEHTTARPQTAFFGHLRLNLHLTAHLVSKHLAAQAVVSNDVRRGMAVSTCSPYKRGQFVPSSLLHDHV